MSIECRTLTIMLSDMVGFTAKTSRMSRDKMMDMLKTHDELIRPVIGHYRGRVVKTIGDAFMSVFESPTNAVLCAIRTQYVFRSYNKNRSEEDQLHVRISLNAGEVQLTDDGDVFGEAVNIAARVEGVTPSDEIYFTDPVYLSMNRNEVPETLNLKRFNFKGIQEEITVYRVLQNDDNDVYMKIVATQISAEDGRLATDRSSHAAQTLLPRLSGTTCRAIRAYRYWKPTAAVLAGLILLAGAIQLIRSHGKNARPAAAPIPAESAKKDIRPVRDVKRFWHWVTVSETNAPEASASSRDYAKLLRSENPEEQRTAARELVEARTFEKQPGLLKIVRAELLKKHTQTPMEATQLDALGWFCHVLGASGKPEDRTALEKVRDETPHSRLKRYAEGDLKKLQTKGP